MNKKVWVVGWDGATWRILQPLIEAGQLPNLGKLAQRSAWGQLQSTRPPVTATAWSSFMTGLTPGRHGLFDWQLPLTEGFRRPWINATALQGRRLWEWISLAGKRAAVLNVPLTYPPRPLNGVLIGGMLTPNRHVTFTYPTDFQAELLQAVPDYVIDVDIQNREWDKRTAAGVRLYLDAVCRMLESRRRAVHFLLNREDYDFFMVVFTAPDRLQHPFWAYAAGESVASTTQEAWTMNREGVVACYRQLDAVLGEIVARADDETTLFMLSDHGFGRLQGDLALNNWLAQHGWLRYRAGKSGLRHILAEAVKPVKRHLPLNWVKQARSTFSAEQLLDWSHSVAYSGAPTEEGIWLNVQGREPAGIVPSGEPYERLRDEIIAAALAWCHSEDGQPLIRQAKRREEVHSGPYLQRAPDILLQPRRGWRLTPKRENWLLHSVAGEGRGNHEPEGILLAAGPKIAVGKMEGARLLDMTPTLLHALELAVPAGLDGRVLSSLFRPGVSPVRYRKEDKIARSEHEAFDDDEAAAIAERLAGLGYLE